MAMTSKNREISDKLDLALFLYREYGYDPFNDLELKRKGEKVSVVVNGNLYGKDPFDVIEELLGDEAKDEFRAEHLARHDEGKPIPPDVQELREILGGFVEQARFMVWSAKEEKTYNADDYGTLDFLLTIADEWAYMIGEYYPDTEQRKEVTRERPVEIVELFDDNKQRCDEFFAVPNDHNPAWWARRTKEFVEAETLDLRQRGSKALLWSQIIKEHTTLQNDVNKERYYRWLKEKGIKSK